MKTSSKHLLTLISSALLAACAGGGHVPLPDGSLTLPKAAAEDPTKLDMKDAQHPSTTLSTQANNGTLLYKNVEYQSLFGPLREDRFLFQAADGKIYTFTEFNRPLIPGYADPVKTVSSRSLMQGTDNNGKLFACCGNRSSATFKPGYLRHSTYGVWINAAGQRNFFAAGVPAETASLQGYSTGAPAGKATYQVLAIRTNGSHALLSSHNTATGGEYSTVTVNFNTNKVGGNILGNSDFGPGIDFKDVSLNGNEFSGSVQSGSEQGTVKGALFAPPPSWGYGERNSGREIGGLITFSGNSALDAAFGGSLHRNNTDASAQDLTPLP